ncbi:Endonuclease/Exonuclease/phosphatase family protein [Crateriforma conspicua]|uniref:Endonuclease/Exonuclease/phosphatase family protein n=1 Tax=Crateriforma conspicua TaxID=2527996 RepID=A0A5C5Y6M8_9PLAN|nr:Endonuclease/Exonuclease/phosphatase family protein [Crateriforma conspicua]
MKRWRVRSTWNAAVNDPSSVTRSRNAAPVQPDALNGWGRALRWIAGRTSVLLVLAVLMTLAGYAGRWQWFADAMNHTRCHLMVGALVALAVFAAVRWWRWALTAGVCFAANFWSVWPVDWVMPERKVVAEGPEVRVLFWNVHASTDQWEQIQSVIHQADADVVALIELNHALVPALQPLRQSHPHYQELSRSGAFGLGVYSRRPVTWVKAGGDPAEIRGTINAGEADLDIWAVHTLPPMGTANLAERNGQLRDLAVGLADDVRQHRRVIVGGDFNITPWTREFRKLVQVSGCRDSRDSRGYQATWPRSLGPLGIPIDHVLVSPDVQVIDRTVIGGDVSDHRAVLCRFRPVGAL